MKRIDGIDITRGLLALSVAIYHYIQFLDLNYLKQFHGIMTAGIASVDGFFAISGFALFYSYHKTDFSNIKNAGTYFYKRFARIAPLFYLCMLLNTLQAPTILLIVSSLFLVGLVGEKKAPSLVKYPFLIITFILLIQLVTPLTNPSEKLMNANNLLFIFGFINTNLTTVRGGWSIGIEYVFYFLLPFILCSTRNDLKYLTILTLFTIFLAVDYQFLNNTNLYTYNSTEHVQELVANWPLYTNPLNHFYFFMAGILLFIVYERYQTQLRQKQQLLVKMILILLVIYMVLDKIVGNPSYGFGRFCYSLLTLAIISLTPFIEIKSTWLRKKLIMLGDISYSVYLIQFPVYTCVIYLTRKFTLFNKTETFFIALLSLLSISYFIYKWYEVPSKNWLTNLAFSPRKNSLELSETT